MNRIDGIGLELEGGWRREPRDFYGDGSVGVHAPYVGEINNGYMSDPGEVQKWMKENYPDSVDGSCGFHIHLSFLNTMYYVQTMTPRFYHFWMAHFKAWSARNLKDNDLERFTTRFNGHCSYAKKGWNCMRQYQMADKGSARYYHLNYCYGLHKTLEFKMLPMFETQKTAAEALDFHLWVVNEWFNKLKPRAEKYNLIIPFAPGEAEVDVVKEVICV